jgi:TonB family protein
MITRSIIPFLFAIAAAFTAAGTAQGQPADTVPLPPGADSVVLVPIVELPRPTNLEEFKRVQQRNYPRLLRDAGVGDVVHTRFRVLRDGSVDVNSITIDSSYFEELREPTIRSVSILRFQPARIATGPVDVWVSLPVVWAVGP